MSPSIPASALVDVLPSVLSAGGNPLSLNSVFLTEDPSVPIGTVLAFANQPDVASWFGAASIEATLAGNYFSGYDNAQVLPSTLYFAQFNTVAVAAYLRSANLSAISLSELQALAGTLIVVINGETVTSANINLAAATSFTNAAALIQAGLQVAGGIFTGSATIDDGAGGAGNTLTVTVVGSGAVHIGDTVVGAGIAGGTHITAFGTGTGGLGTYTVSGAAQHITPAEAITVSSTATVTFDSQRFGFVITSPTTGATSTIGFATGSLAAGLQLTAALGAVTSQGADPAVEAGAMAQVTTQTKNWATFMTVYEPLKASKIAFAQWVQTTKKRYGYVAWDSDPTILTGAAPASFGAQCVAGNFDGIFPIYEPATDLGNGRKAAFVCGTVGSIDFTATQGRLTFAFKGQAGLFPDITDETTADNLKANGYNFYGDYATANDQFINLQPGSTPGAYKFFDPYINQIWLNNALQLAYMNFLQNIRSVPYNTTGYNLLRATGLDPIQQGLNNGVIQPGITLSNAQKASVNTAAGASISDTLQTAGYYLQIKDADPIVRANRGSPPMTLWYTDGGSIQKIVLASINVQ